MAITEKVKEKLESVTEDLKGSVESLKEDVRQIKERLRDMVPLRPSRSSAPIRPVSERLDSPFHDLQRRTNQLFEEFFEDFGRWRGGWIAPQLPTSGVFETGWPRVDVSETENELLVAAELPGVDKEDIELSIDNDLLTIRGHKRMEQEDRGKDYYRIECFQGSFIRTIPLPVDVDADRAEASFKKQVLKVKLPKTHPSAPSGRRIEIKA